MAVRLATRLTTRSPNHTDSLGLLSYLPRYPLSSSRLGLVLLARNSIRLIHSFYLRLRKPSHLLIRLVLRGPLGRHRLHSLSSKVSISPLGCTRLLRMSLQISDPEVCLLPLACLRGPRLELRRSMRFKCSKCTKARCLYRPTPPHPWVLIRHINNRPHGVHLKTETRETFRVMQPTS